MAYQYSAEKRGERNLVTLHERLTHCGLIEFFPVEIRADSVTLGISIPFKAMDDARFVTELESVMTYLISEQKFQVTDLFTGNPVAADDISGLAERISG